MIDAARPAGPSSNALKREGIHTVGELVSRSEPTCSTLVRNFGAKSISEIMTSWPSWGLPLAGPLVDYVSTTTTPTPRSRRDPGLSRPVIHLGDNHASPLLRVPPCPRRRRPARASPARQPGHAAHRSRQSRSRPTRGRARRLRPYVEKLITKGKAVTLTPATCAEERDDKLMPSTAFFEESPQVRGPRRALHPRHQDDPARRQRPISWCWLAARKEIVEDAVATATAPPPEGRRRRGQRRRRRPRPRSAEEKADKAENADKAEYAGAVRLEEGAPLDAPPDDDHLVKGNEDP